MAEQLSLLGTAPPKRRVLVFDLETMRSAYDVGGWENVIRMGMACGVIYDSQDEQYHVYEESQAKDLVEHLKQGDLIVGFNHIKFDYTVLAAYTDEKLDLLPSFDMLVDVTRLLGHRLKLNSLATATLGESKSADGIQSLEWVKQGKMDLVREYCKKDVDVTKRVFEYGAKEGRVLYFDRDNESVQLRVDWDVERIIHNVASGGGPNARR